MNSELAYNLDFLSGALGASCNKELQIVTKNHVDAHRYSSFDMDALRNHTLNWLNVDVKYEGVIYIQTNGSKKVKAIVSLSDTVESVKNNIFEDLPLSQKSLKFVGREMENEKSLMDYGVTYEDILKFKNKKSIQSDDTDTVEINITCPTGEGLTVKWLSFKVDLYDDVVSLKTMLEASEGIPIDHQRFVFGGRQLEDGTTWAENNIKSKSTIHLVKRIRGGGCENVISLSRFFKNVFDKFLRPTTLGGCPMYTSDPKMFDPNHNLDFTNKKDDGRVFMRGGQVYNRPYGWNKVALNVKDTYNDTDWLGGTKGGQRMHEVEGEWPVSYHGTKAHSANKIALEGFDGKKGKRFKYGRGIYSTPDPEKAEKYATVYEYQGKKYKVLIQNRVNMDDTAYIPSRDFFLTADEVNIRPYGLLFKEIKE